MKIDPKLISAALDLVLQKKQVAALGAIPLKDLAEYWESTRLRSSDLAAGIEILHASGSIGLEARHDGLWIRRKAGRAQPAALGAYEKLRLSIQELGLSFALTRLKKRQGDGYCGMDRRLSRRSAC